MKEALLVLFGFLLGQIPAWVERYRRRSAHWRALESDAELCRDMAAVYLHDDVFAPLYRLPLALYHNSFPVLLSDGAVSREEVQVITRFFNEVETLNRGLDSIAAKTLERSALDRERNRLKAEKLIGQYYRELRDVLDSHR